ncbi:MAG: rhomboid family intramembrane serine protease [Bacteroidales bacterium]|mgnify:CR=1 FL=1|nr:rhomboid family intramembrane serine protease [Bacteroidales bacterium]MDD4671147.1 rhomboid family intramembrane serine protease [Bacteroidales bacterium]
MTEYGYRRPGIWGMMTPVIKNLVIINTIMLIATYIIGDTMYEHLSLFAFESPFFKPYQLVTHMFMHGGFWHLFFNMYTLIIFGSILENMWGSRKFLLFYFVTGLGAALCHNLVLHFQIDAFQAAGNIMAATDVMRTPTVGASGAIYGVLLGYGMLFPNNELQLIFPPVRLKAKWFVIIFGVIELATGLTGMGGNIAHFAHLGGMLFGLILILYWKRHNKLYH